MMKVINRFQEELTAFSRAVKGKVSRKRFLKYMAGSFMSIIAGNLWVKAARARAPIRNGRKNRGVRGLHDITVAEGAEPYRNTVNAVRAIGGMGRFVKKGDTVFLKANISWDRTPAQAANTDPQVIAALIDMCYEAGAGRVNMSDNTCNNARRCYLRSGIEAIAREHGARIHFVEEWDIVKARFTFNSPMEGWPIFREAVDCDVFINAPVLKHHGLTGWTLSMKNLMGVCSGIRGMIHMDIGRKLADLTQYIAPDLTIMDATRVLARNGPSGGDLDDVVDLNKVIAGVDPVLVDAFSCTLMKADPMDVTYIKAAVERGYGSADISSANIVTS